MTKYKPKYELRCDLCHSDKNIRHLSMPLWQQEKGGKPHLHICESCLRDYYPEELLEKLIAIDTMILHDIQNKELAKE